MNGSHILLQALLDHNITTVFGYPGGAIMPLYDALPSFPDLTHVLVRHEQATVFAAQGRARSTGTVGVAFATSGPGCANTLTALADAMMDSIPVVLITGQVFSSLLGKDAFQEMDVTGVTMSITKHNMVVRHVDDLETCIHEAFRIASSGRPGPVHVDVPKDIFFAQSTKQPILGTNSINTMIGQTITRLTPPPLRDEQLCQILDLLYTSHKPILLIGQGVKISQAEHELMVFVQKLGIPVVTTLLAKGAMPDDEPNLLGQVGMHGRYESNMALYYADCIINLGSRFDDRIVGTYSSFGTFATIVHVDIDASELGKVVKTDLPIHADAKVFLEMMNDKITQSLNISSRRDQILQWKKFAHQETDVRCTMPNVYMQYNHITANIKKSCYVVTDVGQHQMRAWQYVHVATAKHRLTSGGAGSMGFGIPAAMGVSFAHPDAVVTVFVGDGGFQMSFNELQTIAEHKRNIKIIILNNGFLGMVRQWQELFFDKNYSQTPMSAPSFEALGSVFGIPSWTVDTLDAVEQVFGHIYTTIGPALVDCRVIAEENVFPMVPAGKPLNETICG